MGLVADEVERDPARGSRSTRPRSSIRAPCSAPARSSGRTPSIGEHVRIGRDCRIGASSVVDGPTEIGDGNEIFPFASIGLIPQDLKFTASRRGSSSATATCSASS